METIATEKQSLDIIYNMIQKAKQTFHKTSFYYLLWGWLMTIAGIGEYVLSNLVETPLFWLVWPILGFSGGIITMIYSIKQGKQTKAKGYLDEVFLYLWVAYGVTLVFLIIGLVLNNVSPTAYVIVLTGLPTFASGRLMKFKPLEYGGYVFWLVGLVTLLLNTPFDALLFSGAIVLGYLIPGYLLKKQEG